MTNALLLRLFTSEFFNSWIAVSYLFRYSDNVGIQHYLCNRLKKFPVSEIEFFLPQLIHLLITRPSDSVALECFLVEISERSTHMAVMTLWYLQAYLSDLSLNPNSPSFELCKRLLNKCQAIVFSCGDNNETVINNRVKENAIPALVGMGAFLLGVGQPRMTKPAGRIAIAQGRRNRTLSIISQQEDDESQRMTRRNTVDGTSTTSLQYNKKSTSSEPPVLNIVELKHHSSQPNLITKRPVSTYYNSSLDDLQGGKAFSRYIKNAQQKINQKITKYQQTEDDERRVFPSSSLSQHLSIYDPNLTALGQSSVPTNTPFSPALSNSCCCSTDEIQQQKQSKLSCSSVSLTSSSSVSSSDDEEIKSPLFHSNYFRSEMQFLLALGDIATRLVIVPKEARMSALHAELTLLNHHLPADICLPLWCPATSEKPFHHRIAPYLLMIEVLDDEMRFEDADFASMLKRRQKQHKCMKKKTSVTPTNDVMDMVDYYKETEEKTVKETTIDDYADRMRTAAVMLTQLQQSVVSCNTAAHSNNNFRSKPQEQIRQRIIKEMMALEEQRVLKMKTEGGLGLINNETDMLQEEQRIAMVVNKEDPSAAVLSEDWETKKTRLRAASPYGHLSNWRLISVIVKNGTDLRQEQFAVQLIREMQLIWADTGVNVWVK
ncbi:hypothetical protein K501DRAFT_168912 [Backusella circina FSU 941]|nr:hypothetical protein K501DRAFT_168912 [Backusella circina FSU 941]